MIIDEYRVGKLWEWRSPREAKLASPLAGAPPAGLEPATLRVVRRAFSSVVVGVHWYSLTASEQRGRPQPCTPERSPASIAVHPLPGVNQEQGVLFGPAVQDEIKRRCLWGDPR